MAYVIIALLLSLLTLLYLFDMLKYCELLLIYFKDDIVRLNIT